ncbi:conserved Plasmodium protein, unknown function [Plasmodium gallinaceum]|uniref:Uncharacterized protein n=1 Tax=Plasmodium gallinaceum TaxID=5849 RepID=A0A1J1GNE6_PLAGA|nr:conserved Plasmodium protein, unknown function [Plasmodium gallinaceum]CRG93797.1 conserved Plasmodium protein, unknown function [Plasmodium gallinaceum]
MKGSDKIDFESVKSSYLEKDLKIKNNTYVKNLNIKNDIILEVMKNKIDANCLDNCSFQNYSNKKDEQKFHYNQSLIEKSDENHILQQLDNKEQYNHLEEINDKENEERLKTEKVEGDSKKEDIEENEGYQENIVSKENENFTEVSLINKISKFVNKTKDAYSSLKVDKLFLCHNINDLINDRYSDINIEYSSDKKKKFIYENKNEENVTKNANKNFNLVKNIEDKIKNNKSTVLKNIYNSFKGTLNDFIDVYLEKDNDDNESLYDKIYDTNKMVHKTTRKNISKNCELILNNQANKIKSRKSISDTSTITKKNVKSDIIQESNQINKTYIYDERKNNKNFSVKNNMKEKFIGKSEKNSNNDNNIYEMNSIYNNKTFEVKKNNTIHKINNDELINEKDINYKKQLSKEMNKNINYHNIYESDINKFEYSDIISHYLYNNEDVKNKCSTKNKYDIKNGYDLNKKSVTNNIDYIQQKKKSKIIDVQTIDKNVFNISSLTQKYKYRSNIILTINKIKNIEKVIEININITDIQLKIPGMRIENVILPYKYSNDLLTIQIKTLNEDHEQIDEIEREKNDKSKNNLSEEYDENMIKHQLKEEISSTIKYYYLFIPLNNIKEEIINKQLILITSKYKKIFEKEKLLPDTIYLIQSKNMDSMKEKHLYISIKKCVNGIHFYPNLSENNFNNLNKNNLLDTKESDHIFKPVYVSLYNDEVDREIGNIINENNLINKIKINKLPEKGYYIINNNYLHFYFNKENVLVCNNNINNKIDKNQSNIENASNFFNLMSNDFISVKSCIDLFPFYIFPSLEDVDYFDFMEKNQCIKLKFMLHFLAILELICTNLCSFMNISIKTHSLFYNHIKAVQIDDENNERKYFTFLYTSHDEKSKTTNYSFNYVKPFIFEFKNEQNVNENEEKDISLDELNNNDIFIYNYARKQSLFLYNIIKNYEDIKNIIKCYDEKKHIFYTTDYNKKHFQDYYINILYKYNKLIGEGIYNKENEYKCKDGIKETKITEKERIKNNLRQKILEKNSYNNIYQNNYKKLPENIYISDNFLTSNNKNILLKRETKISNEKIDYINNNEFNYRNNVDKKYFINEMELKNNNLFNEKGKIEEYNNSALQFKITNNNKNNKIRNMQNINSKTYNNHESNEFVDFKEYNNYHLCGNNSNNMKEEKNNTVINIQQNKNDKKDLNYINNRSNEKKNNTLNMDICKIKNQNTYLDQFNTSKNEEKNKLEQKNYSNDILDVLYEQKKEQYMYKNDISSKECIRQKINNNLDFTSEKLLLESYDYFNGNDNKKFVNENKIDEYESIQSNVMNFSENGIILDSFTNEDENNSIDMINNSIINSNMYVEKNTYHNENDEKKVKILNFENLKIHNDNINGIKKKCKLIQRNANCF